MAGVALLALVGLNGCAGVVAGSNSKPPAGTPGTPPPGNTPQPQLSASPSAANFPNVTIGSSSSQTITVANTGSADATISTASVMGAGLSVAGLAVPAKIAAGQNATFNLVFSPSSAGNVSGSVSLTSDAANSPLIISATASAVASTPLLISSVSNLSFGDVSLGGSSSLGATLANSGNTNVTISGVSVTGTEFSVTGVPANTTVAPGQTASLNITFAPMTVGAGVGSIAVNSNSVNAVTITLGGNGVQPGAHAVALSWDPSTAAVIGYYVYRAAAGGSYAKLNTAAIVNTQYADSNLQSGQTYTYVVTAVDADNVESSYSDPVLAAIP